MQKFRPAIRATAAAFMAAWLTAAFGAYADVKPASAKPASPHGTCADTDTAVTGDGATRNGQRDATRVRGLRWDFVGSQQGGQ